MRDKQFDSEHRASRFHRMAHVASCFIIAILCSTLNDEPVFQGLQSKVSAVLFVYFSPSLSVNYFGPAHAIIFPRR